MTKADVTGHRARNVLKELSQEDPKTPGKKKDVGKQEKKSRSMKKESEKQII
jgi:hypothetical protein